MKTAKTFLAALWNEDDGVMSFEWVMLASLLTVGVVSGVAGVRNAIIDEFADMAGAITSLDQSYTIAPPLVVVVHDEGAVDDEEVSTASRSVFVDVTPTIESDLPEQLGPKDSSDEEQAGRQQQGRDGSADVTFLDEV